MKKNSILILFIIGFININHTYSQKNNVSFTPFLFSNNGIYEGKMVAYGIDFNYSRNILKNLRFNTGFGMGDFTGKNSTQFELEDDEKGSVPLTRWAIGIDYVFMSRKHVNLMVGADYLISRFPFVESLHTDSSGEVTYRQVSISNTQNVLIHLKMENKIGSKTFWTTQISYQPYFIDNLEVIMLNTGIG
jgi:hypothetical protein